VINAAASPTSSDHCHFGSFWTVKLIGFFVSTEQDPLHSIGCYNLFQLGLTGAVPKNLFMLLTTICHRGFKPATRIIIYAKRFHPPPGVVAKKFIDDILILPIPDKFTSVSMKDQDFEKIDSLNMVFNSYSYNAILPIMNAWMHIPLMEHIFRVMCEAFGTWPSCESCRVLPPPRLKICSSWEEVRV